MVASFSYDDGGRRVGRTLGDTPGTVTTTTYGRADNLPTAIADNRGIVSFGYTYDANKNKLSETLASPMAAYGFGSTTPCTYDNEDRLTAWHRDDVNYHLSWSLSSAGDWDSYTLNSTTQYFTHNEVYEISSSPYLHDAKGCSPRDRQSGRHYDVTERSCPQTCSDGLQGHARQISSSNATRFVPLFSLPSNSVPQTAR